MFEEVAKPAERTTTITVTLPPYYVDPVSVQVPETSTVSAVISLVISKYFRHKDRFLARGVVLKQNPKAYMLCIADDEGRPDSDCPAIDAFQTISELGGCTFALAPDPDCPAALVLKIDIVNDQDCLLKAQSTSVIYQPNMTLSDVKILVCEKKFLDPTQFDLVSTLGFPCPLERTVGDYGATEIMMVRKGGSRPPTVHDTSKLKQFPITVSRKTGKKEKILAVEGDKFRIQKPGQEGSVLGGIKSVINKRAKSDKNISDIKKVGMTGKPNCFFVDSHEYESLFAEEIVTLLKKQPK
eukprot:TRINITY_DN4784_c0_g1_i3.p1 TRINITY_DN4784_c0_g1~~TRINITY_DN4784_c0_g1_i3.p1  ORF type:complete len:297 (+),score=85.04 TRINITY_DN4784_c0_g1_i3:643-1533(+)